MYRKEGQVKTMGYTEMIFIAVGLAMDAFALALCLGLPMHKMDWGKGIKVGIYFGFFQGLMPFIGYLLGKQFAVHIVQIDHWIAFILLTYTGINMLREAHMEEEVCPAFDFKTLFPLSIACSIDAFAIGITFAFFKIEILDATLIIALITAIISIIGVKIGHLFGSKLKSKADILGGMILILMGIKILIEHLF